MLKKTANSVKKFAADHKVGIAVIVTATASLAVGAKMSRAAVAQREDFMQEAGILEAFNAKYEED